MNRADMMTKTRREHHRAPGPVLVQLSDDKYREYCEYSAAKLENLESHMCKHMVSLRGGPGHHRDGVRLAVRIPVAAEDLS